MEKADLKRSFEIFTAQHTPKWGVRLRYPSGEQVLPIGDEATTDFLHINYINEVQPQNEQGERLLSSRKVRLDEAQRLTEVRQELTEITPPQPDTQPEVIEALPPKEGDTPLGILRERQVRRQTKERRERQMKGYKEKLLVISDLQLLQESNEGGIGALVKYIIDQGHTFTHVVLNGDIMDFTQQSGFRKNNQLGDSVTRDEQVAGRWFIDLINQYLPDAKKVYMKGNHEARYDNLYLDTNNGVEQYLRPFEEVFGLQGWEVHTYGNGESYDWHGRKIRHGTKSGAVMNIPKIEMERNWHSNTVGHAITNRMWEHVDADGNSYTSFVHAGFSKTAAYDKSGDKKPSNGFGVYYWTEVRGKPVETAYQIIFPANNPRFISPEGTLYDGTGYNLRQEIGLDPRRGRPKKGGI